MIVRNCCSVYVKDLRLNFLLAGTAIYSILTNFSK